MWENKRRFIDQKNVSDVTHYGMETLDLTMTSYMSSAYVGLTNDCPDQNIKRKIMEDMSVSLLNYQMWDIGISSWR